MALKHLNDFRYFDNDGFFKPKQLLLFSEEEWIDYQTKKARGIKLNVVIMSDSSDYKDATVNNAGQPLTVKIEGMSVKPINAPTYIRLVNPQAKIYGEYNNQLSVVADGFEFVNLGDEDNG